MKPPNIQNAPKAAQTAAQNAAAAAKKVAQDELLKMKTEAKQELGLPQSAPPDQESMPSQEQGENLESMKARFDAESAAMLRNIEAEINQIRLQRQQAEQQRLQQQQVEAAQVQQVQEEKKAISMRERIGNVVKSRVAGKREQGKQAGG